MVDDADYDLVSSLRWHLDSRKHRQYARDGNNLYMHRLIVQPAPGQCVDHRDGNGLNNTRGNLRPCTPQENSCNSQGHRNRKGYKGVYRVGRRWEAVISLDKRQWYLGLYLDERRAAFAYDAAARYYFGRFAHTNFPGDEALPAEELRRRSDTHSGFKYISKQGDDRWRLRVRVDGKLISRNFPTQVEAEAARDALLRAKDQPQLLAA
jgi:hypothetical protein